MKFGTIMPSVIVNDFRYGAMQVSPHGQMAAVLLTPLPENSIFVISQYSTYR